MPPDRVYICSDPEPKNEPAIETKVSNVEKPGGRDDFLQEIDR